MPDPQDDSIEIHGDGSQQPDLTDVPPEVIEWEPTPEPDDTADVGDRSITVYTKDSSDGVAYEAGKDEWSYTELGIFINYEPRGGNDVLIPYSNVSRVVYGAPNVVD